MTEKSIRREQPTVQLNAIVCATSSPRRLSFLNHAFPDLLRYATPALGEIDHPSVVEIAKDKRDRVREQAELIGLFPSQVKAAVFAADTRAYTPFSENDQKGLYSRGKPSNGHEVMQTFKGIRNAASDTYYPPFYVVESGSAVDGINVQVDPDAAKQTSVVRLNEKWVKFLSTKDGLNYYKKKIAQIFNSHPFVSDDVTPIDLTAIAGGISLPLLTLMGAVESVDGTERKRPGFRDALKKATYTATVGISPTILEPYLVSPQRTIDTWPWLNNLVDFVLAD